MIEISHQHAQRLIRQEADARLPEEQWAVLQGHMESCEHCRAYRQRMRQAERGLRRALRAGWAAQPIPSQALAASIIAARCARTAARRRAAWALTPLVFISLFWLLGGPGWLAGLQQPQEAIPVAGAPVFPSATPAPTVQPGDFPGVVAFAARAEPGADSEIYLLNPGTPPENLSNHPGEDTQPVWSPDGEWIAFLSDRSDADGRPGSGEVFVSNLTGSRLVQLTHEPGITWQGPLSWSRDGQWIALTGIRENQGRQSWIYLVPLDGSGAVALPGSRGAWSPKFARYGSRLAYAYADGASSGIAIHHLNSEARAEANWPENSLSAGPLVEASFDWSIDSTALAFIAGQAGSSDSGGQGSASAGSRVMAVRDLNYSISLFYDFEHNFRVAESTWPNAFRAVTWTPGGAVVYLESLRDARARPSGEAWEECWRIQSRMPGFTGSAGMVEQIGGLCVESGFDSGSWTTDGSWLVALGRTDGEQSPGLYAVRIDSRPFGSQPYRPPEDTVENGRVLRLTDVPYDFALPGALAQVRPRLRTYEPPLLIDPQPVALMRYEAPPSDLSARSGGPEGKFAYVMQSGQTSMVISANPDGTGGRLLYASQGQNRCPRWSPDGRHIALLSRPDADNGGEGSLASAAVLDLPAPQPADPGRPPPDPHPGDGFLRPGPEEIYIIDARGGAAQPLRNTQPPDRVHTRSAVRFTCPLWSPAGAPGGPYLAALLAIGENNYLAVLPLDPDSPARFIPTGEPLPGVEPVWSPDGHSIFLAEYGHASRLPQVVNVRLPDDPGQPLSSLPLPARGSWGEINGLAVLPNSPYLALLTLDNPSDQQALAYLRLVSSADGGLLPPGERGSLQIGQVDLRGAQRESRLTWLPGGSFGLVLHGAPFARHKALLVHYNPQRLRLTVLAELEDRLTDLAWSPDGRWLIYSTESGLWGLEIEAARTSRAAPAWLSPVPVQDLDWR